MFGPFCLVVWPRIPQIRQIYARKSAQGLSFTSLLLENFRFLNIIQCNLSVRGIDISDTCLYETKANVPIQNDHFLCNKNAEFWIINGVKWNISHLSY